MPEFAVLNFDVDHLIVKTRVAASEKVTATPLDGSEGEIVFTLDTSRKAHLVSTAPWTHREMLDYLTSELTSRFPEQVGTPRVRAISMSKRFIGTWGAENAQRICRYVFENLDGQWSGSPVNFGRFSKKSDPYFAEPIAKRLGIAFDEAK